jgi:hypothetical protein
MLSAARIPAAAASSPPRSHCAGVGSCLCGEYLLLERNRLCGSLWRHAGKRLLLTVSPSSLTAR